MCVCVCSALNAIPVTSYELPDGQSVEMSADRFRVAEALFQPEFLRVRGWKGGMGLRDLPRTRLITHDVSL